MGEWGHQDTRLLWGDARDWGLKEKRARQLGNDGRPRVTKQNVWQNKSEMLQSGCEFPELGDCDSAWKEFDKKKVFLWSST